MSTAGIRLFFGSMVVFFLVLLLSLNINMGWGASKNRLANRTVCQTPFVDAPPRETWTIREEERGSIEKESEGEGMNDQKKRRIHTKDRKGERCADEL